MTAQLIKKHDENGKQRFHLRKENGKYKKKQTYYNYLKKNITLTKSAVEETSHYPISINLTISLSSTDATVIYSFRSGKATLEFAL